MRAIKEHPQVKELFKAGKTANEISKSLGVPYYQVYNIVYQLKMQTRQYEGMDYKEDQPHKVELNKQFYQETQSRFVLDVFSGKVSTWKAFCDRLTSNDKDPRTENDYHMDAEKLLAHFFSKGWTFDIVDLDPYGTCFGCLPLATQLAEKGIIVSYGDFSNWRYKRFDFLNDKFSIFGKAKNYKELERLLIANTIYVAQAYAKKRLIVWKEWHPSEIFFRVYYKVEPIIYRRDSDETQTH